MNNVVAQGRDRAVLFGIEPLQPGFACVYCKALGPCCRHRIHEGQQLGVGVALINADAVFHCYRQRAGGGHGGNAAGHLVGIGHQTGPKAAFLHLLAGAAHIQVDFVVAPFSRQGGGLSQQGGIVAAHLQG